MAKKNKENETAATAEGRTAFRMSDDATIHFGVDAEGNAYSSENSPKKGEATKGRWALYQDGMTVAQALDAGMTRSNIRKDRRANYITITNPEKSADEGASDAAE